MTLLSIGEEYIVIGSSKLSFLHNEVLSRPLFSATPYCRYLAHLPYIEIVSASTADKLLLFLDGAGHADILVRRYYLLIYIPFSCCQLIIITAEVIVSSQLLFTFSFSHY